MALSVIVPAYEAAADLPACLAALDRSTHRPHEILVVDDGSRDGTGRIASRAGATVLVVPGGPRGPAAARNIGARAASGDVLVFLDADVAVHADALDRLVRYFAREPGVAAIFGSYDDRPARPGIVSRYRNLLHHFVHQHGRREATTFWAGCGAMRRDVFFAAGGFDERYRQPSIEDIELGDRLHRLGHRIWLCPDVQGTHLKRWTLAGVVRTDILRRAIPWTRLILRHGTLPADLNTSRSSRLSAVVAWGIVACLGGALFMPALLWPGAAGAAALVVLNARLYRFFARHGGVAFTASAIGLHALYLLYSSAVFGGMAALATLRRAGFVPTPHPR